MKNNQPKHASRSLSTLPAVEREHTGYALYPQVLIGKAHASECPAEAAKELRVRTYTIGVGTRGTAPYPGRDMFGGATTQQVQVSIDEELLTEIAQSTGGRYFRATSETKLREIFSEIDRMEKTRIEIRAFRRYAELFYPWAIAAVIIAGAGLLLSSIYLKGVA